MKSPFIKFPSLIVTSGAVRAAQFQELSAARLLAQAERAYISRDVARMSRAADALLMLQSEGARAAGLFYRAMCERRAGRETEAARLLASVANCQDAPRYRARAIQALGLGCQYRGEHAEAIKLYSEAIKASRAAGDPIAFIRAGFTFSEVQSEQGDHQASLNSLRAIRPAIEVIGRAEPFYFHLFSNEVAFELSRIGRLEEARRFATLAVSSPYADAWPEWRETAREIEEQAASIAARKSILRVVARPARSRGLRRPSRTLFLIRKLALKASRRPLQPRTAIFTRELPRIRPTLEQVSLKIRIRAPSF